MWKEGERGYYQQIEAQKQMTQQLPGEYVYNYADMQGYSSEGAMGYMQGYGGQTTQNHEERKQGWGEKGYMGQRYAQEQGIWGIQQQGTGLTGREMKDYGSTEQETGFVQMGQGMQQ